MDVGLFAAVVWRSKRLVLFGVLLGAVLAVLAYGTPSFKGGRPTITPRGAESWTSESQLLITQPGDPYGRAGYSGVETLASLSPIYATLANGNAVQEEISRKANVPGSVTASESLDVATSVGLPFINLLATAPTKADAETLVTRAAQVVQAYVNRQQADSRVPANLRIELPIDKTATGTKLVKGHKLSIPILLFFAVFVATLSLVFLKEGFLPRVAAEIGRVRSPETAAEQAGVATATELELAPEPESPHIEPSFSGAGAGIRRSPVAFREDR